MTHITSKVKFKFITLGLLFEMCLPTTPHEVTQAPKLAWRLARVTLRQFISFHWLHAPERIKFKLVVIVYRGIHGTAPRYLSDLLHRVSDITSRRCLRSSTSSELIIPLSRLVTVGDRSFAVAGPRL